MSADMLACGPPAAPHDARARRKEHPPGAIDLTSTETVEVDMGNVGYHAMGRKTGMKKMTKRFAGAAMALLLAVAVLVTALPANALAVGTGKLIVTSDSAEFSGKNVTIWKMFDAVPGDGGKTAGYTLAKEWEPFFTASNLPGFDAQGATGDKLSAAAYEHVAGLQQKGGDAVDTFARSAAKWAKGTEGLTPTTVAAVGPSAPYTATFSNIDLGYYLVVPQIGASSAEHKTSAMLRNVLDDKATITLKSKYPTVEKAVDDGDTDGNTGSDAQIGDTLKFTLSSTVPELSEYEHFNIRFVDTLSKGLSFASVTEVKIGDKVLTKGDSLAQGEYMVSHVGNDGQESTLTITLKDLKSIDGLVAGQKIVVTYTAVLNEHAVIGNAESNSGNDNSAKIEWGTTDGSYSEGVSKPDVTKTYTFDFKIKKVDGGNKQTVLEGVEFKIMDADGKVVKLAATGPADGSSPLIVRPAKNGGEGGDTVVTPASGLITFQGFDAGSYTLVEVKPLAGYNKLPDQAIDIKATYNPDGTLKDSTITIGGKSAADGVFVIENNKGALLPETGGIGTVLFTLGGAALIGYGVYRKRSAKATA